MKIVIRNRIRRLRFESDEITQRELARREGCTRQTIHAIEDAKYGPSLELAIKVAEVFGVAIDDVFLEGGRDRGSGRAGSGRGPRQGERPPGSQAGQYLDHARGPGQSARFRTGALSRRPPGSRPARKKQRKAPAEAGASSNRSVNPGSRCRNSRSRRIAAWRWWVPS